MTISDDNLRDILSKIADLASAAAKPGPHSADGYGRGHLEAADHDGDYEGAGQMGCFIKPLPKRLLVQAADTATKINPINAAVLGPTAELADEPTRMMIAIVVGKYWGAEPRRLTVSFMESTPSDLRARIVSHMNAWNRTAGVSFVETQGIGEVRISRGRGGYWSYLGTDILHIPRNRPTMNLQGFTMNHPEREFKRVVRHEAGHTLGMPHEHMRKELVDLLDRDKTYTYFRRTQGWDKTTVDQQVLTPLDDRTLFRTPADQTSIMCYQLPGEITRSGRPIPGGDDINATDYAFAGERYPKSSSGAAVAALDLGHEWSSSEDVTVHV